MCVCKKGVSVCACEGVCVCVCTKGVSVCGDLLTCREVSSYIMNDQKVCSFNLL